MNIQKIISDTSDQTIKEIFDGKFRKDTGFDKDIDDLVKQNEILMNYIETLLRNYHEALKVELSKQGIKI